MTYSYNNSIDNNIYQWLLNFRIDKPLSAEESNITVPIGGNTVSNTTPGQLSPEGNVPIVGTSADNQTIGISIEKTTDNNNNISTVEYGPFTEEEVKVANQRDGLTGEIPGYFILKDDEARQETLNNNLKKIENPDEALKEFERLNSKTRTTNDANFLGGAFGSLPKEIQIPAADDMLDNKRLSGRVRIESNNAVARNLHNLHEDNQLEAERRVLKKTGQETKKIAVKEISKFADKNQVEGHKIVIETNDKDLIKFGSTLLSELASTELGKDENGRTITNQTKAVEVYQNSGLKDEAQKEINKNIIDQYGSFTKNSQLKIHDTISASKFSETVEYAASNIYKFHADNQKAAFEITVKTDNEAAINAAAAQWAKYDDSAKTEIKYIIENTNYESVKETLAKAEIEATEQKSNEYEANYSNSSSAVRSEESPKTTNEKIAQIQELIKNNSNTNEIEKEIKNLSKVELIALLNQTQNVDIVKAILNNNPSLDILAKIDPELLKELGYKKMTNQICFLSADAQKYIVEKSAEEGNLSLINRAFLLTSVKSLYDNKLKLFNKGNRQVG